MRHRVVRLFWGLAAAACLLAGASNVPAALDSSPNGGGASLDFHVRTSPTADVGDPLAAYMGPAPALTSGLAAAALGTTAAPDLSVIPRPTSRVTLRAPLSIAPAVQFDPFAGLNISGLSTTARDERATPLSDTALLSMGPGGFGRIMAGRPMGSIVNWADSSETSISYVRPHMNVQMMLALEVPGNETSPDFEGPGMTSHAVLDIDHRSRVDSAQLGQRSDQFGGRQAAAPVDEPQTAVAVGLDLGVLPTFLAQMGVSVSVVVSRGQQTGDSRVALVGATELPIDWSPREHPDQNPHGVAQQPTESGVGYGPAFSGGGGLGGGSSAVPTQGTPLTTGTNPTPIVPNPPVPEPATLTMLAVAAAGILAARRRKGR